jgi:hypothetical protein
LDVRFVIYSILLAFDSKTWMNLDNGVLNSNIGLKLEPYSQNLVDIKATGPVANNITRSY